MLWCPLWSSRIKETDHRLKLHLLVTASAVIVDFELAAASDLSVGYELLSEHQNKQVIGDKAYSKSKTNFNRIG